MASAEVVLTHPRLWVSNLYAPALAYTIKTAMMIRSMYVYCYSNLLLIWLVPSFLSWSLSLSVLNLGAVAIVNLMLSACLCVRLRLRSWQLRLRVTLRDYGYDYDGTA